ncbi:uncharacterized protein LOC116214656 isoform X2 [Punica granatum]|uniref:Uncharacterized protein LOC116214656 isoform X2 n=1 Tax=Punica granatum TaxID=22663 RepID=A0A218VRH5_PUNGR|nr:uncharacterized protein LOC116214656 isoform X2 [Punica granatum]OWM62909.1 hypothetical protein CDL15_Pgr020203 [Punica granatum]
MGVEKEVVEHKQETCQEWTLSVHAFSDLTNVSPTVFLYLMKACYTSGTFKATTKFRALQHRVHQILHNSPQPGPAAFVIHCLYALPTFGIYSEGFSHLLLSALRRFLKSNIADSLEAKDLAAQLFLDIVGGFIDHDEKVALKVIEVFDVGQINLENVLCRGKGKSGLRYDSAITMLQEYIFKSIESQSFMTAVSLLEHFSIRHSGQSFLLSMLENNHFMAAEKFAKFMGKPMLCILVQEYVHRKKLKNAYQIIKQNNLQGEFSDVYHLCKESSLKKLAEKGCWDVAELKAKGNKRLIEYLVYLAMEAGYSEKVDELCDRFSLQGFPKVTGLVHDRRYLNLTELAIEGIIWVDDIEGLQSATCHIEGSKVIGIDCEWKPNYEKGSKPNKVSIMQISSDRSVFIVDLLRLSVDVPDILDNCLKRILRSPRILKLGYNFQCDMKQLASSYRALECFKHCDMLLDIQCVFREPSGGLSGLAQKILGAGLNKTRRNSNWEQRPLSQNQLEYAALDAAVLVHIFSHVRDQSQPAAESNERLEWKSHIISHGDITKRSKRDSGTNKKRTSGAVED